MKKLCFILLLTFLFFIGTVTLNAQCTGDSWDFNEDDFAPGSISQTEAGTAAPATTNQIDLNADGTLDIEVTYEAIVTTPNANGTCDDGDFSIGAGWGGTGALTTSSDFAGTTSDDCPCNNGIIVMTVDMINGFNSDVANFQFEATSQNGSSEAYEYGFGFVSAATDSGGNPITGLNTAAATTAAIANYCNAQYVAGMTVSSVALSSTTGVFTTQADDLNATANTCTNEGQNGEDTGSGSGPNSGLTTGVSGLASTDLITQVTYIYGLSNAPGSDCDADGDTGVGSSPSGSFAGIDGCFTPPCSISGATAMAVCDTADPTNAVVTVTFDEANSSGNFNILDNTGATVGTATGTGAGVTGTFTITGPTTAAPGTVFTIQDGTDLGCMVDITVDIPECMIICPDYTATISGGGRVCNSGSVDLFVTIDGGTGPYTIALTDGTTITGYNSGDAIPVSPTTNTTYGLSSVSDADDCPGMIAGMAEVMVIISCANAGSLNGN